MKIQIDLKSALLGLAIGAAAIFTLGNVTEQNSNGRYQCSTSMDGAGNNAIELIVDTQTGQAWSPSRTETIRHDDGDKFFAPKQ